MTIGLSRRGGAALLLAAVTFSCSGSPESDAAVESTAAPAAESAPSPTAAKSSSVPREAPALTVRQPGGTLTLADYRGQVVGLVFILTDCPHCQKFSRTLEKVYQEFSSQGFQPIAVAVNEGASRLVRDFSRAQGVTFPVGFTGSDTAVEFMQHPSTMPLYMPQFALIDREGKIRSQHGGSDEYFGDEVQEANLRNELQVLLAEGK